MSTQFKNIARVIKAQGSKGEVVVASLRGLPFCLREGMSVALTPPALDRDRFVVAESVAPLGTDRARVLFSCCRDLDAAEAIVGCHVLSRVDDLELGALDVAFEALIGREVRDARLGVLGRITEVMETPANDVWAVDSGAFGEVLLPVIPGVVDAIPEDGPIEVHVLEGLVDEARR